MATKAKSRVVVHEEVDDLDLMLSDEDETSQETIPQAEGDRGKGFGDVQVVHIRSPLVTLYDREGIPSKVSREGIRQALASGFFIRCPLCNGTHPEPDPNACPARPRVKFFVCPYCLRHGSYRPIYDDWREPAPAPEPAPDPNRIDFGLATPKTAEERIRGKFVEHCRWKHETEARADGLIT